jgi:hypothetical protein
MDERTAGIDLASAEHRLGVVDGAGRQLEQRRIKHSEAGVQALIARLHELQVARVAIERPNGLAVDRLLEAGISVVPVHPNQLAAARDRSGGGKSDGLDGYVLAELARTDSTVCARSPPTALPQSRRRPLAARLGAEGLRRRDRLRPRPPTRNPHPRPRSLRIIRRLWHDRQPTSHASVLYAALHRRRVEPFRDGGEGWRAS